MTLNWKPSICCSVFIPYIPNFLSGKQVNREKPKQHNTSPPLLAQREHHGSWTGRGNVNLDSTRPAIPCWSVLGPLSHCWGPWGSGAGGAWWAPEGAGPWLWARGLTSCSSLEKQRLRPRLGEGWTSPSVGFSRVPPMACTASRFSVASPCISLHFSDNLWCSFLFCFKSFPDSTVGDVSCSSEIQFGGMGQTRTLSCGSKLRNISGLFFFF